MNRCPTPEQLRRLLDDDLADPAVEAHAAGCAACQLALERLAAGDAVPPPRLTDPADATRDDAFLRQLEAAPPWERPTGPRRPDAGPPKPPRIAGYEVLGVIGQGGMGVVYKARHLRLNRLVALKLILAGKHAPAASLLRFQIEAEAVAALTHANIVQLHEVGEADGCPYLALEYVGGGTLDQRLRESPCPPTRAAELVRQLALAVDYAHRRGVVHRDLKPANVLLAFSRDASAERSADASRLNGAVPKVTDFGLAKLAHGAGQTVPGDILGTPNYMAPEQAQGRTQDVGPAADVYSLGAILYEALAGRPPFLAATAMETLLQVMHQEPVPPSRLRPGVPRDLETICLKCLDKEPIRRYASAEALADDLRRFLAGEPIRGRPVGLLERGVKWARRRPAAALLAATVCAAAIGVQCLILWYNARLEGSLRQAEAERDKATEQEHLTRRGLYAAHMHLAQQALEQGQVAVALTLLDQHRPEPGDDDLRGFEWYHLWRRCNQGRPLAFGGPAEALAARWGPAGPRVAVRGREGPLAIWDAGPPKHLLDLPIDGAIKGGGMVAFAPDGRRVAVVADGSLRLWDVGGGQEHFAGQWPERVTAVAFAPDGKTLAVGDRAGVVTRFDVSTPPRLTHLARDRKHDQAITALAFSPSGTDLAWCGALPTSIPNSTTLPNRVVKVGDVATGREYGSLALPRSSDSSIARVAFAPDGKTLAVARGKAYNVASPDQLLLLETATLRVLASQAVPNGGTWAAAFSPDGRTLATGETSGVIRLWGVADAAGRPAFTERGTLFGHTARVWDVWFSPDGGRLLSSGYDRAVLVWDVPPRPEPVVVTQPGNRFRAIDVSPDGRTMATTDWSWNLVLWDLTTRQPRGGPLPAHNESGSRPAFSPDGTLVAAPQRDSSVKVWEAATGRLRATLTGHGKVVAGATFRPDGALLATAGKDGVVRLWDTATWREVASLTGHHWHAWSVAFAPDGRTLATGDEGGTIRLWDVQTQECLTTIAGPGAAIRSVMTLAFAPDGKSLAAGTYDANLAVWHTDGRKIASFPRRHSDAIVGAVFTPDGQALITGSKDGTIKIWDVRTRQERLTLRGHADQIHGLALTRDGELLVSAGEDGTVRLWHAPTGEPGP